MTGDIVHFELQAKDSDRAQQFWSSLWGWEFQGSGMPDIDYRIARVTDKLGAAIAQSDAPQGYPNVYFSTDDIDARGGGALVHARPHVPDDNPA